MFPLHFGAVDVGSNAARLLIASVDNEKEGDLRKSTFVRVPLRLGEDVFATGEISQERASQLLAVMDAYKNLLQVCHVTSFRICATAAMRETRNRQEIVKKIKRRRDWTWRS